MSSKCDKNECKVRDLRYIEAKIIEALNNELKENGRNSPNWKTKSPRRLLRTNKPTLVSKGRQGDERELYYVYCWIYGDCRRLKKGDANIFKETLSKKLMNACDKALKEMSKPDYHKNLNEACKTTLEYSWCVSGNPPP